MTPILISTKGMNEQAINMAQKFSSLSLDGKGKTKARMLNYIKQIRDKQPPDTFTSTLKAQLKQLPEIDHRYYNVIGSSSFCKITLQNPSDAELPFADVVDHLQDMGAVRPTEFSKYLSKLYLAGNDDVKHLKDMVDTIVIRTTKYVFENGEFLRAARIVVQYNPDAKDKSMKPCYKTLLCRDWLLSDMTKPCSKRELIDKLEAFDVLSDDEDDLAMLKEVKAEMLKRLKTLDNVGGYRVIALDDTVIGIL